VENRRFPSTSEIRLNLASEPFPDSEKRDQEGRAKQVDDQAIEAEIVKHAERFMHVGFRRTVDRLRPDKVDRAHR